MAFGIMTVLQLSLSFVKVQFCVVCVLLLTKIMSLLCTFIAHVVSVFVFVMLVLEL